MQEPINPLFDGTLARCGTLTRPFILDEKHVE
jgi:hypothetical protein